MEKDENVLIAAKLIEKTDNSELAAELLDTTKTTIPYWVFRLAALIIWAGAIFLSLKLPTGVQAGRYTMQGELESVATLGLCIILFATKRVGSYTDNSWFVLGGVPINKPSPLGLLRLVGWMILLGASIVIAAYVF